MLVSAHWVCPEPAKMWDSLALGLQTVMSHHVGSGKQTWVLWKANRCSKLLSHPSRP